MKIHHHLVKVEARTCHRYGMQATSPTWALMYMQSVQFMYLVDAHVYFDYRTAATIVEGTNRTVFRWKPATIFWFLETFLLTAGEEASNSALQRAVINLVDLVYTKLQVYMHTCLSLFVV